MLPVVFRLVLVIHKDRSPHLVADVVAAFVTTPAEIARAAETLAAGGLVAFPTETVYGVGAHALDARTVAKLFEAKGDPDSTPSSCTCPTWRLPCAWWPSFPPWPRIGPTVLAGPLDPDPL